MKGEVVGIVGKNGAGKSTLLKILSQITPPTTGEIKIHGTVGSLLEVGTGFHPELTGRENIFLNGAILGIKKKDIIKKFNEIVEFAGIEKFLDTPVKHYSSGMYVRLAFSVAAHMETDILIIDEVLAVGDAEFQKKCLGKMEDITKKEGRTILFVSHNMEAVRELCSKCIQLKNGMVERIGKTDEIINHYLVEKQLPELKINNRVFEGPLAQILEIQEILVNEKKNTEISPLIPLTFKIKGVSKEDIQDFQLTFSLYYENTRLFTIYDSQNTEKMKIGNFISTFSIPEHTFRPGTYTIAIGGQTTSDTRWFYGTQVYSFKIIEKFTDTNDANAIGIINVQYESNRIQ
jgi:lipopolysaccharide transport system ATP-binding protein